MGGGVTYSKNLELSIIIPVYNVEKYLEECLNSVLEIRDINYEVLVVNDGSLDNSQKIIDEYCKKNNRVKSFMKENGGASSARNYGLEKAQGEYIWFVDSDDLVVLSEFDKFFKEIKNLDLDVVLANYNSFYNKNDIKIKKIEKFKELENLPALTGKEYFDFSDNKNLFDILIWKNIYKRKFLLEEKIFFEEGIIFEDELFSRITINRAKKVKYFDYYIYLYRQNVEGSVMQNSDAKLINYYKVSKLLTKEILNDKLVPNSLKKVPIALYVKTLKKLKIRDKELEKEIFKIKGLFFYKLRKKIQILFV